ncbi:MAG TPA: hypothetical protein H9953_04550 [Candidatus Fusicatenibacter intestinipullorum]|nr:hypothetical protein [Candidatus Fusicatenibacter intestinipullorum]
MAQAFCRGFGRVLNPCNVAPYRDCFLPLSAQIKKRQSDEGKDGVSRKVYP